MLRWAIKWQLSPNANKPIRAQRCGEVPDGGVLKIAQLFKPEGIQEEAGNVVSVPTADTKQQQNHPLSLDILHIGTYTCGVNSQESGISGFDINNKTLAFWFYRRKQLLQL